MTLLVRELGSGAVATSGVAAQTFTLTATADPDDLVVILLGFKANAAITATATDSRGNTWFVDRADCAAGTNNAVAIASTNQDKRFLASGDTITVTLSGDVFIAGSTTCYWIEQFDGVKAGADVSATNHVIGTTCSTGTTAPTAQPDELAVAVCLWGTTETTIVPTSYNDLGIKTGAARSGDAAYRYLTDVGQASDTFTASPNTDNVVASIATYKAYPTPTARPTRMPLGV